MNKLKTTLFYLTIAALFTPFLVDTASYFPFIIAKATAFRLIVEAMLVIWVFWLIKKRNFQLQLSPLAKAVIIFGVILFISALFGVDFNFSLFSGNERMEGVFGIWHFMLFFLIITTTFKYLEVEKILKAQIGIGILYSFIAILAYSGIGKITSQLTGGRLAGYTGNPSFFAIYLLFNAFLSLYFYFKQYVFDKRLFNWWLLVFLGQSFLLFATLTRGAMIGYLISILLAAVAIILFLKDKNFFSLKKIMAGFLICILALSIFTFAGKNTDFVKNNKILSRFSTISLSDPTALSRLFSAGTAWKSFLQKPLLGWGTENYESAYVTNFNPEVLKYLPGDFYFDRAHNKPMEVLATTGIFGFLSYLSVFGIALYFLNRLRKKKEWFLPSLALAGGLIGYFVQNIFIFDFYESYLMFFLFLAFISSLYRCDEKPNNEESLTNNDSKDYASKMGKGLLVVVVVCGVIFSTTQWVMRPYLVSKGISNVGFLVKQEKSEEAYKELKKIINNPAFLKDDIIMGMKKMYSLYSFKIDEEYKKKMVEILITEAKESAEKRPWRFSLIMAKADLDAIYSQWDKDWLVEAEKSTENILSQFPYFPQSHLFASKSCLLNGDVERSITEAEKVIELNPKLSTSYYILGLAYNELGDFEKRGENLIKAAELNFPFKDKAQILSIINLLAKEKKYNTIKNLYIQAIQIDPDDISLYTGLAATYAKMHNKEGSIYYAKKVLEMNPGSKQAVESFIQLVENEQWELIAD
jgi:O-antigen ligase